MMGHSDPSRWGPTHLVEVACTCADIENCTLEQYISDIRLLQKEMGGEPHDGRCKTEST